MTLLPNFLPGAPPPCGACERPRSVEESLAGKKARAVRALSRWEDRIEDVLSPPEERRLAYRDRTALKALWTAEEGWRFGMEGVRTDVRGSLRFARPPPLRPAHRLPGAHGTNPENAAPAGNRPPHPMNRGELSTPVSLRLRRNRRRSCSRRRRSRRTTGSSSRGTAAPRPPTRSQPSESRGLWFHANPAAGVRLFAKRGWRLAWGSPRSIDSRGLLYGSASFSQLLPELHDASLEEARNFLAPIQVTQWPTSTAVSAQACASGGNAARTRSAWRGAARRWSAHSAMRRERRCCGGAAPTASR